jgi:hypothetical protein
VHEARTPALDSPPLERYGFPQLITGTSPAAGADFTYPITGRYYTRLVSCVVNLDTDSNAASREVVLQYLTAENQVYCTAGAPVTVSADSVYDYTFSVFQPEAVWPVNTGILVPLSPVIMRPTDKFRLHLVNAQATDALTGIRFLLERFYSDSPIPG